MSDTEKNKDAKKEFKGKVTRPFSISGKGKGSKGNVSFNVGDEFSTTNKNLYDDLVIKNRIK